jgi:acyl transferase domain-containing protein/thioesterase domain-containing protein
MSNDNQPIQPTDIAIVGMAVRFPGARDLDAYWNLIQSGENAFTRLTDDQLKAAGVSAELRHHQHYMPVAGLLEDVEGFDSDFFGIGPRDAALMDPQHRHFLECCWEALENAGHVPSRFDGSIGVYAGSGMNGYLVNNLLPNKDLVDPLGLFAVRHTSNDKDFLSTGVSYRLNLTGPSVNVQTACSTSLVALHLAAQALIAGECDMALAGGVTIEVPHGQGYLYREGEVLSRDGICRAFDAASSGTILTSGAGVIVLRRLSDAVEARDHIYAVVKATAINNDGSGKAGYLAPSVDGHAAVVAEALELAGVSAESIQYVEAHGTGTPVGDPIEVAALTQAFRRSTDARGFARIGSAKPTIGHLDTAAGVASVIKTSLALEHQTLPPMANFTAENPLLDIESTPFVLSSEPADWPRLSTPRRAGISSLGVGGTNAHAVLEEAPERPDSQPPSGSGYQILTLSGKNAEALARNREKLADYLSQHPDIPLHDVAWTLQTGRTECTVRDAVAARTVEEAASKLRAPSTPLTAGVEPSVVFMFPGGGAQYPNMGKELYETEPVYRAAVDESLGFLEPALSGAVRELLFPPVGHEESAAEQLSMPSVQLPAIFLTEYALARLWMSWGIVPDAMTGHSLGEYVAACLAGVFSLEDALQIVALRGRLMERVSDAAMLSVALPESRLEPVLVGGVSLAAVNAPELCVVSGANEGIEAMEARLAELEVPSRRLRIRGAIHSALLDPYLQEFARAVGQVKLQPPRMPYISNVTGNWVKADDATSPDYWVRHLRYTVRFADGLATLLAEPNRVLIEVGPGNTLATLARQQTKKPKHSFPALPRPSQDEGAADLGFTALARAWSAGVPIEWTRMHSGARNRLSLPPYQFARTRHWYDSAPADRNSEVLLPPERWTWRPAWTRSDLPAGTAQVEGTWLVAGRSKLANNVAGELRARGAAVVQAAFSEKFERHSVSDYRVRLAEAADWQEIAEQCANSREELNGVIWLQQEGSRLDFDGAFFGPVALLQGMSAGGQAIRTLTVVSSGAYSVDGEAAGNPTACLAEGPVRVASREFEGLSARLIDVSGKERRAARMVVDEALHGRDAIVALRNSRRFVRRTEEVAVPELGSGIDATRGVLITGGFGGLGLSLARHLAQTQPGAKFALLSRRPLPPRDMWPSLLHGSKTSLSEQLEEIAAIEASGAEVLLLSGDVSKRDEVEAALQSARVAFGTLSAVVHAAGSVDDGPMVSRTRLEMEAVLSPKVAGADAVIGASEHAGVALVVLCSSVSAELGLPGQVDYAAANAYLSALAARHGGNTRVVSIPFGRWDDVGSATGAAPRDDGRDFLGAPLSTPAGIDYVSTKDPESLWVFNEHRLPSGVAVMPGTGFVQLFASVLDAAGRRSPKLDKIEFLEPLQASDGQAVRVTTRVRGAETSVQANRTVHATARIGEPAPRPAVPDIDWSAQRFDRTPVPSAQAHVLRFGPRWDVLRAVEHRGDLSFATLALDDQFAGDIESFSLSPALLDIALSAGIRSADVENDSVFAPVRIHSLSVFGRLPQSIRSVVTRRASNDENELTFDALILDEPGSNVICSAEGVTYRRVSTNTFGLPRMAGRSAQPTIPFGLGLTPELAWPLLERSLASGMNTVGICSIEIPVLQRKLDAQSASSKALVVPRPQLATELEAPRDDLERSLAAIWSECLGIQDVGINDDFFDLGGHSLIGLRLIARVQERFARKWTLRVLQELPTISAQAEELRGSVVLAPTALEDAPESGAGTSLVPFTTSGSGRAIYCVHGMYGNVMAFKDIADALSREHPFYGIEKTSLSPTDSGPESVQSMAAKYVEDVRREQPEGPYILCGYSAGGWIALEMAHQLRAAGEVVQRVILLDSWGPAVVSLTARHRTRRMMRRLRFEGPRLVSRKLQYMAARRRVSPAGDFEERAEDAPDYALGQAVTDAVARHPVTRVEVPVTLICATLREPHTRFIPRDLGWRTVIPNLEVVELPVPHLTMCTGTNATKVAKAMADALQD